ncbi:MAG: hypothetical protein OEM02_13320, partial [Desulfobulbaceae bacterium]|nr:hypothetical protein [Desulfobulbaceae bacterium]
QRSDVFSMGAILYELVTLGPARSGDTAEKLQWAVKGHLNLIKHALTGRKVAPELKAIIGKATELAPQDRYSDIMALAEDVRRYLMSEEVSVYSDNLSRRIWRKMSRYREASVITILSILLILSTIAAVSIWRKAEADQLARHREQLLTTLQASVSEQGYAIDSYFSRLENLAASLAQTAVYLIEKAPPNTAPVYFISDFQSPERAPADYRFSPLYDKLVSTRCPVARLAPGVEKAAVVPMVQRLAPMGYFYRQMFVDSQKATGGPPATDVEKLLRETGVPVRWAYIGLQSGVMFSFPGKTTYTEDFDPRKRPWYVLGADSREVRWSNPYVDVQGQGPVLACATALYGRQDRFLGVLGMDVTFSDIIDTKMHRAGSRGVIESYLLNGKGQIVVRTKPQQLDAAVREKADTLPLTPFPVAALTKAITRSNAGLMAAVKDGSDLILVFSRLPSLGWFYVESIDANVLLGD